MWQPLEVFLRQLDRYRYRRNVQHSLALYLRGEAREDGLSLLLVRNRLEIRWRSRDVHPWDAEAPPDERTQLFHEQLVADTEAAILRLFRNLPQVDRIDLEVLEPASENVILTGTVLRSDLSTVRRLTSVRMRLQQLGVVFEAR